MKTTLHGRNTMATSFLGAFALSLCACGNANVPPQGGNGEQGEEHGESGEIVLTPEQIETSRIGVATTGPGVVEVQLPLYGVIAPNAERVRQVTARFPGVIRTITKRVGDPVRQGETLATVESDESLQTYGVAAPIAGVITERNANPGEHADDGPLFSVADLSTVWVELSLFPRDIDKVTVGQSASVRSSDSGLRGEGKIVYVAPFGSSANQTLTARVLLDNADRKWPPGLYVTAELTLGTTSVPLAVRSEALQTLDDRTVVFVRTKVGFEAREVQIGRSHGEVSEITAGLKSGEAYATSNSFILKAELGKGEAGHDD